MMLTVSIDNAVIAIVEEWVKNHPEPDKILVIAGNIGYSPMQILEEININSEFGKLQKECLKKILIQTATNIIKGNIN